MTIVKEEAVNQYRSDVKQILNQAKEKGLNVKERNDHGDLTVRLSLPGIVEIEYGKDDYYDGARVSLPADKQEAGNPALTLHARSIFGSVASGLVYEADVYAKTKDKSVNLPGFAEPSMASFIVDEAMSRVENFTPEAEVQVAEK